MTTVRILDLDGSVVDQAPVMRRLEDGRAKLFALRSVGPSLRLWATDGRFNAFDKFWHRMPASNDPVVTMVGSGDFHHLTASFIGAVSGPLSVIHFDNHPDWCWTMPKRHCGSWVNRVLAMPHVKRVVTIGPCSDDLERPDRKGADLDALSSGRLEVFPWKHPPSNVRKALYDGAGHVVEDGHIHWYNLAEHDWTSFLDDLVDRLPSERIWITVDKDVLSPREAVTNWDQGDLPLDNLIRAIGRLVAQFELAGADICGDYAPIRHHNPFKYVEARLDQPRPLSMPDSAVNAAANERLLTALEAIH